MLFFAAETAVIHLHIGRSAHSFSMSEVPLLLGPVLPRTRSTFLAARFVGAGLALVISRRQRSVKLAFNLSQFMLSSVVAMAIFHAVPMGALHAAGRGASVGPADWIGGLLATFGENVVGVIAVCAAISLAEGTSQFRRIPEMLETGTVVAMTNASLVLLALTVVAVNPLAAALFVIPLATAFLAYRSYISQRQQHEGLEMLFESTRILQRSPQLDSALLSLLDHARKMFRADVAEITLLPARAGRRSAAHDRRARRRQRRRCGRSAPTFDDPLLARAVDRAPRHARTRPLDGDLPLPTGERAVPERDGGAADRRYTRMRRHDRRGRPAERHQHVRPRRPEALRDARQPHGRRPRERPAGAVARRALGAQGRAAPPGLPRLPDRAREPRALHGAARANAWRSRIRAAACRR